MFSGKDVKSVNDTNIFGRLSEGGRQFLAYQMAYEHLGAADGSLALAMVLPIPVVVGSGDDAVSFIDLSEHDYFFGRLGTMFPSMRSRDASLSFSSDCPAMIKVHQVGDYEASFVPSLVDFERLDDRFRLDDETWNMLPGYDDFGFAVFKLRSGNRRMHPMAFSFPTRLDGQVFFPTVHVHDGEVHGTDMFDHKLYAQVGEFEESHWGDDLSPWTKSRMKVRSPEAFGRGDDVQGILDPELSVLRRTMKGRFVNHDVTLRASA